GRTSVNVALDGASPEPSAVTAKIAAATSITGRRPTPSATRPPASAPAAQPSKIDAPAKPVPAPAVWNEHSSPSTAPFTTALSKPKRNPPSAAAPAKSVIDPRAP